MYLQLLHRNRLWTLFYFSIFLCTSLHAQVGINTAAPSNGTVLDITSGTKGVLFPRIALTATTTQAPVTGTLTNGTFIYNTAATGSGTTAVTPGYYYWNVDRWRRMTTDGYSVHFNQTAGVTASTGSFTILPGLNQSITAPFTGTYQIVVTAYYNTGSPTTAVIPVGSQGSVKLEQNGVKIAETLLTSVSVPSATRLPQQITIVKIVTLTAGVSYNFRVSGREWRSVAGVASAEFGNTHSYTGNLGITDAVLGSMTITLVKSD